MTPVASDDKKEDSQSVHVVEPAKKPYRILALDGGGIRGLITAVWLHRLQQELVQQEPESSILENFDLIAGTSTGSILACAIALGKNTSDLVNLYKERGKEIFPPTSGLSKVEKWYRIATGGSIYKDEGLERVLRDEFKEHRFGELKKLTFVVAYDTLNRRAVCFNSQQTQYSNIPVWEICKASSSAPGYFPAHVMEIEQAGISHKVPLIDGGVVASNPTACAIAEGVKTLRNQNKKSKTNNSVDLNNIIVVSLGTGDANKPISIQQAKQWGVQKWMLNFNITGVMFDGMSQAMDHVASNLLCSDSYFRFQTKLYEDSLDDVSEMNLNKLHALADSYFNTMDCKGIVSKLKAKMSVCKKLLDPTNGSTNGSRNGQVTEGEYAGK